MMFAGSPSRSSEGKSVHVARDDAVRNGFFQCRIVHQTAACKIVSRRAPGLCCRKQLFIKGISCLIVQRNVQRNVILLLQPAPPWIPHAPRWGISAMHFQGKGRGS